MRYEVLFLCIFLLVIPATAQVTWCGSQMLYFQQNSSVDPAGYEELQNYPSGLDQEDDNVTITSAMGPVLIDTYITPENAMEEVTTLRKGLRVFNSYDYVSSVSGTTQINFTAFQRFSNGTEKVFYSQLSEDINALVPTVYVTNRVSQIDLHVNPTDRLGIKVYAQTTHPSPITVHFLYMGQTNVSHFMSGYFDCTQPTPISTIPNLPAKEDKSSYLDAIVVYGGLIVLIVIVIKVFR